MKYKSPRSFLNYNEGALQTAIECFFLEMKIGFISELMLIKERIKKKIKYGFADLFVSDVYNQGTTSVIFELKHIGLIGLYCGDSGKVEHDPAFKNLLNLNEKLENESEDDLLNRLYTYWCKKDSKYKTVKLRSIYESGYEQLCNYMKVIIRGDVCDNRLIKEVAQSYLRGYFLISIGICRIIIRDKIMIMNYQFFMK